MRTALHVLAVTLVPVHVGYAHLVKDTLTGIVVGIVLVSLYMLVLRWQTRTT